MGKNDFAGLANTNTASIRNLHPDSEWVDIIEGVRSKTWNDDQLLEYGKVIAELKQLRQNDRTNRRLVYVTWILAIAAIVALFLD